MKAFVLTMLWFLAVGVTTTLYRLGWCEFPIQRSDSRPLTVVALIVHLILLAWGLWEVIQ